MTTAIHPEDLTTLSTDLERIEEDQVDVKFETVHRVTFLGVIELILKNPTRLHRLLRDQELQPQLLNRFLAISLVGFLFFGLAMSVVLSATGIQIQLTPIDVWLNTPRADLIQFTLANQHNLFADLFSANTLALTGAYAIGLIAATGVCLPSLYFYGLLAGVKLSMLDVTLHSLKSKSTAAVALVGILPVYAAVAMGAIIFDASVDFREATLWVGLILPFVAGLWGTHSLYQGFEFVCKGSPEEFQINRACFLRRLVLSWSAIYTAVTPVMIFTLWEQWL